MCACAFWGEAVPSHCYSATKARLLRLCTQNTHIHATARNDATVRAKVLLNNNRKCPFYLCYLCFSGRLPAWQAGPAGWRALLTSDLDRALSPYWLTPTSSWWQLRGRDAGLFLSVGGCRPRRLEQPPAPAATPHLRVLWNWQIFPPRNQTSFSICWNFLLMLVYILMCSLEKSLSYFMPSVFYLWVCAKPGWKKNPLFLSNLKNNFLANGNSLL